VFQGSHPYRADEKGRIKLPAEFSEALGASFTLTRGQNGCLWMLPASEWQALVARLQGESIADQRALALQRYFIGSAVLLSLDGQGRLSLPPVLRQFAGIQQEIMLVGIGARIEVWARERWEAYQSRLSDEAIEELARSAGL
jgi:MraZ protein